MKKRDNFEKKYPLFAKYFDDANVRSNMLDNTYLYSKYQTNNELITSFIYELDKRFDIETVKNIIIETIIKLPDEIMLSLITAYLNSNEAAKNNSDFIAYYNRTSNLGRESIDYIEKNGLVTNRSYKDIPDKALVSKYQEVKSGNESFKGVKIDNIFYSLSFSQKKIVISLIESGILEKFDEIFEQLNFDFITIIDILMSKQIDASILNKDLHDNLGSYYIMILICLILDNEDIIGAVTPIKNICAAKRFDLLKELISVNLLLPLSKVNFEELEEKTDEEIIDILRKQELVLKKQEN